MRAAKSLRERSGSGHLFGTQRDGVEEYLERLRDEDPKTQHDAGEKSDGEAESDDGGYPEPLDDPFDLVSLARLPDIYLQQEDRLWWDAVLAQHVTVLSGQPHVGKTTLLRFIVHSVATGAQFLGWNGPPSGVPVIILDFETPGINRKASWEAVFGKDLSNVERVHVALTTPALDESVIEALVGLVHLKQARLVVIDTLARAFQVQDENQNAQMNRVVGLLKRVADAGPAVVVIAHDRKEGGEGFAAVRGASATVGGVDITVSFRQQPRSRSGRGGKADRVEPEDVPYVLEITKSRTTEVSQMIVYRTPERSFRTAQGTEGSDHRARSVRVIDSIVLAAGENGITTAAAVAAADARDIARRTAMGALATLVADGAIVQPKNGIYVHKNFAETKP